MQKESRKPHSHSHSHRVSASARWSLWPLLRPKSDYLPSLCITSRTASRLYCVYAEAAGPKSKVKGSDSDSPGLVDGSSASDDAHRIHIADGSPVHRAYLCSSVHYFRSWRVLYSNKTRARRRCQRASCLRRWRTAGSGRWTAPTARAGGYGYGYLPVPPLYLSLA